MQKHLLFYIKLLILLAFIIRAEVFASDFRSPRSTALGGAGHASPLLNDSIYQNPSFASFTPIYSWSSNWRDLGDGRGRAYSISVVDGLTEMFQAGAGFQVRDDLSALHLAASKKISSNLALGIGGKMFFPRAQLRSGNIKNLNLSASANPFKWFRVSLVADNLLSTTQGTFLGLERELILGTKFIIGDHVSIYIDPRSRLGEGLQIPNNPVLGYEAGAEIAIFRDLYLRAGTFKQVPHPDIRKKGSGFGTGLGWVVPKMSLDLAFERLREPQDRLSTNLGLTIYF